VKPGGRIELVAQLRDLQIVDSDEVQCGIVDDVELAGKAGEKLRVKALLVGPGGYAKRLPRWWMALVRVVAGDACVHVPWREIESITSVVKLRRRAAELGLNRGEGRAANFLPPIGAVK
jgi:sporulation protein YlmC with PRC-barrel domain